MSAHRAIVAAGPEKVHRLCCGADEVDDIGAAALEAIDDPVALLDQRPVAVDALWSTALRTLTERHPGRAIVVHPSWWSAPRVQVIAAAAGTLPGRAEVHPRSWLLGRAMDGCRDQPIVVEMTDRMAVVIGPDTVAVPRGARPGEVVDDVIRVVATMTSAAPVLIDAAGAAHLGRSLADRLGSVAGRAVLVVDAARLARLARAAAPSPVAPRAPSAGADARLRTPTRFVAAAAVVTGLGLAVPAVAAERSRWLTVSPTAPTTILVEGRVALTIPADWITQRVVSGPGSARVQVVSPADPEVALHVTQSPTPGETLDGAAQRLQRAIEAEPAGVFVDFDPAGSTAGRPAVTYREVRAAHDVRWTVLIDGAIRISVGCQSRTSAPDAVRAACEQAVRSAHALD